MIFVLAFYMCLFEWWLWLDSLLLCYLVTYIVDELMGLVGMDANVEICIIKKTAGNSVLAVLQE